MSLRVVLADDSLIIRAGLARLLEAGGIAVAGEAGDAEELLRAVALHAPDVAVVDIRMPPTHTDEGLRAAGRLRREHPGTAVLVLSQYIETAYAIELLDGGRTHVGYLLKDRVMDHAVLLGAVRRVHAGEVVVDSTLVDALLATPAVPAALAALSAREREVLALMAEGLTDRGIAERLTLSPRTVGTHVQHIFDRLGIADSWTDNRRVCAVLSYLRAL
ncbi:response regulator transcription factor [Dactylosporangium darangshiense]|uniref:Response regulator transcription factor n=1 Tax=Dactylosporangium darangshiense TaxID=579108 RepID=A0ABP8DIR7_9ACTN